MKKILRLIPLVLISMFIFSSTSQALTLGNDITIWDRMGEYHGDGAANEDNEVEPGCVRNQIWDLEGFFLKESTLTMVGGFNFVTGAGARDYDSGDLFIDIGYVRSSDESTFGYDYVLDIDFAEKKYNVIRLFDTPTVVITTLPVYYAMNGAANPWKYNSGGVAVAGLQNISFTDSYWAGLVDADVAGLSGWSTGVHYAAAFDLSFLGPKTEFVSHFTIECGNDNLRGAGILPVPEPASIILVGIGLLGLVGLRRFKK